MSVIFKSLYINSCASRCHQHAQSIEWGTDFHYNRQEMSKLHEAITDLKALSVQTATIAPPAGKGC